MKAKMVSRIFVTLFLINGFLNLSAQDATLASIGEIMSPDYLAYNLTLNEQPAVPEAVKQSLEVYVVGLSQSKKVNLKLSAYPSPTTNYLMLEMGDPFVSDISFQLFDTKGDVMHEMAVCDNKTKIEMDNLASAIYLLRVVHNQEEIKTYKVIKR